MWTLRVGTSLQIVDLFVYFLLKKVLIKMVNIEILDFYEKNIEKIYKRELINSGNCG